MNQLIEAGLNIKVSRDGTTPLMLAASKGRVEIAEAIIQVGANVNARSDASWAALHKAAFDQSKRDVIDLLMHSGADIEARNKAGKTALQLAEEKGRRDIVRIMKAHLQELRVDAQEWESFLITSEGRPRQWICSRLIPEVDRENDNLQCKKGYDTWHAGAHRKKASQDGYTVKFGSFSKQIMTLAAKGSWNKVLHELSTKNYLLLVVKEREVFVVPYDPAAIKHEAI